MACPDAEILAKPKPRENASQMILQVIGKKLIFLSGAASALWLWVMIGSVSEGKKSPKDSWRISEYPVDTTRWHDKQYTQYISLCMWVSVSIPTHILSSGVQSIGKETWVPESVIHQKPERNVKVRCQSVLYHLPSMQRGEEQAGYHRGTCNRKVDRREERGTMGISCPPFHLYQGSFIKTEHRARVRLRGPACLRPEPSP